MLSDEKTKPGIVEFESAYGLTESVDRLKALTRRSVFSSMTTEEAVGTVKESHVSLQRVIPMFRNSFKPVFTGRFVERDGRVLLVGRFTMHWFVKIFIGIWFGILSIIGVLSMIATIRKAQNFKDVLLMCLGMMAFGVALVRVGQWLSRGDPAWLSIVIKHALQSTQAGDQRSHPTPPSNAPTITALFLCAAGVMSLISSISGVQSVTTSNHGLVIADYGNLDSRYVVAGWPIGLLILSYGIFRRLRVAWIGGFFVLAASWIYSVSLVFTRADFPKIPMLQVIFIAGSLIVAVVWGRWWYAQQVHFKL